LLLAALDALDVRAAGRIAQDRIDKIIHRVVIAFNVDFKRTGGQITHRPRDWKARGEASDGITKADSLHASMQLENDARYALTSARAPFAARKSIPLSPE